MFRLISFFLIGLSCQFSYAAQHAVILQYHHISTTTPAITSTKPDLFKWQLNYLQKNNYTIWPISKVIEAVKNRQELPEKCVAITFDDAYNSIYKTAFPLLKEKKFPFSIFINTDAVGKNKHHMTWSDLKLMHSQGVEILNHSHTHSHLVRYKKNETKAAWKQRIRNEILTSKSLIDKHIGEHPKIIAYPYGEFSDQLIPLIKELGYAGLGQQSGPLGYSMPLEIIPRFPMGANYGSQKAFIQKLNTLPLPLENYPTINPVRSNSALIPELSLSFSIPNSELLSKRNKYQDSLKRNFQCYVSGQSKAELIWPENASNQTQNVIVRALKPLYVGRARYNCTISFKSLFPYKKVSGAINNKTYFWYSQLWMTPHKNGEWYKE